MAEEDTTTITHDNTTTRPSSSNPQIAMIVPHGLKLRDEFICPITRELIADPVIAADGHTYDRAAIEQWLHGSQRRLSSPNTLRRTSPKTGQPLEHLHLIPNHNLKRLIQDMIKEGGESLYCTDESAPPRPLALTDLTVEEEENNTSHNMDNTVAVKPERSPRLALVREMVLTCRCLGPPESDWNGRSFRLTESSSPSLLGGRRRPHEHVQNSDFVQFTDATVSRRHFEIKCLDSRQFALRDLGSAGGTFVRIPPRKGVPLTPGTMIMLGKHQLLAMEPCDGKTVLNCDTDGEKAAMIGTDVDVTTPRYEDVDRESTRRTTTSFFPERLDEELENVSENGDTNSERASVQNDEEIDDQIEQEESLRRQAELGANDDDSCGNSAAEDDKPNAEDINDQVINSTEILVDRLSHTCPVVSCLMSGQTESGTPTVPSELAVAAAAPQVKRNPNQPSIAVDDLGEEEKEQDAASAAPKDPEDEKSETESLVVLRCFAPEGTPIQGREYPVGRHGATLGRKQGNSISFSHRVCDLSNGSGGVRYSFVGIDSSISGEHATVMYNTERGILELFDGVSDRCSTNGTWVRLSPMHKQSAWYPLEDKTEILIGTVRFQVSIDEVVVERDIYE